MDEFDFFPANTSESDFSYEWLQEDFLDVSRVQKYPKQQYQMHKYWGKKPSQELGSLVQEFTKEGDIVLDPFAGYGVFCCEAFMRNRNVIVNELNPVASFINRQLLVTEVDLKKLNNYWQIIRGEFKPYVDKWYEWEVYGKKVQLSSVLRNREGEPIKAQFYSNGKRSARDIDISNEEALEYLEFENSIDITDWYPKKYLIKNSRISSKPGMKVADLFTKRTLACHARLLSLIKKHADGNELNMLKLAFTANLANCSRLVPPIKSKGSMSQGAWMTGFYIGQNYIENNVLHYYENRLKKVVKGKKEYLKYFQLCDSKAPKSFFSVTQDDAKDMKLNDESVDYVFTDPPYGSAVPYFEQSAIWNAWLGFEPDYDKEIVISDSKERDKNKLTYESDINLAFSEIARVLKTGKYVSITYHSLSGVEWKAITNASMKNGFELIDYKWLCQKTFTPRQINRSKSIKGDVLITLQKTGIKKTNYDYSNDQIKDIYVGKIEEWLKEGELETNEIFLRIMKYIFAKKILIKNVDLLDILEKYFTFTSNDKWMRNEQIRF